MGVVPIFSLLPHRWGWGFHTVRGGVDPVDHRFRPWLVAVVDGGISEPERRTYPPRVR